MTTIILITAAQRLIASKIKVFVYIIYVFILCIFIMHIEKQNACVYGIDI